MKNTKTRELALLSMLSAITILLGVVPNIGIIQIGPISLTILHIPVIIGAILLGIKGGIVIGLVFGVTSWFVAVTRAISPLDLLFINPLISILPRFLFGLISGVVCSLINENERKPLKNAIGGFLLTFSHSFFVYVFLFIFGKAELGIELNNTINNVVLFLTSIFTINALLEATLASVVVFVLVRSIRLRK